MKSSFQNSRIPPNPASLTWKIMTNNSYNIDDRDSSIDNIEKHIKLLDKKII